MTSTPMLLPISESVRREIVRTLAGEDVRDLRAPARPATGEGNERGKGAIFSSVDRDRSAAS